MKLRLFLGLLALSLALISCSPKGGQPAFSVQALPSATSIPMAPAARTVTTLSQRITAFDVSPDGRQIAVATSADLRVYDLHSYNLLRRLQPGDNVGAVAWSPDGARLAIGSAHDYGKPFFVGGDSSNSAKALLTVYDTATWRVVLQPNFGVEYVNQSFADIAWSPDGRSLAYSLDLGGVQLLDTRTGAFVTQQRGFAATVTSLAWSPDGSRLLANHDLAYGIRRWRQSDNQSVRLFDRRAGASMDLAWSPDGQRIASGHVGGGVCIWTVATNQCDGFIRAHRSATFTLAWSPDGAQLATGGGVIRIWDPASGALLRGFGELTGGIYQQLEWPAAGGPLFSLEMGIDGSPNTALKLWDPQTGEELAEFRGEPRIQ